MNLTITDATTVSSLKVWTNLTYKDYSLAIDLTSKLTGAATETIIISPTDLLISYFDGVYFVEANSPTEISEAVTSDLTRYEECILNKVLKSLGCSDCINFINQDLLNAQSVLLTLKTAIGNSFIDEITGLIRVLDIYCSDACKSCGEYKNIIDTNYYSVN